MEEYKKTNNYVKTNWNILKDEYSESSELTKKKIQEIVKYDYNLELIQWKEIIEEKLNNNIPLNELLKLDETIEGYRNDIRYCNMGELLSGLEP